VFPVGNDVRFVDPSNIWHAGAYCLDSGTPLQNSTWSASGWSAACAYEGAVLLQQLGNQFPVVYSLCRPPGHHATRDHFGGYCYLNNVAIAATHLKQFGRVAIVDIDIHHGNGTQAIFYNSNEVYFMSLHGDPQNHYPYFWGSESELGEGAGKGYNLNVPLPAGTTGAQYIKAVQEKVLPVLYKFDPQFLLISAGFDTAEGDPLGTFKLVKHDFFELGKLFGSLNRKTLVVQEGGYDTADLGFNVLSFLKGLKSAKN
jgi:acetoin utilization deacetylase AcuC-like enzyme